MHFRTVTDQLGDLDAVVLAELSNRHCFRNSEGDFIVCKFYDSSLIDTSALLISEMQLVELDLECERSTSIRGSARHARQAVGVWTAFHPLPPFLIWKPDRETREVFYYESNLYVLKYTGKAEVCLVPFQRIPYIPLPSTFPKFTPKRLKKKDCARHRAELVCPDICLDSVGDKNAIPGSKSQMNTLQISTFFFCFLLEVG